MPIKSKQLFVLIGNDTTGKTKLQKLLIDKLCGHWYETLPVNSILEIRHLDIKRKYANASFANRSYQEKLEVYKTVENYFNEHFKQADIAFISSHLSVLDIQQMINEGRRRFYNVIGVFWSNSIEYSPMENAEIAALDWNERLLVENPYSEDSQRIGEQLEEISASITTLLINRTHIS